MAWWRIDRTSSFARILSILLLAGLTGCTAAVPATHGHSSVQPLDTLPVDAWREENLLASPEQIQKMKIPVKVKGIYVTGRSAGNGNFQRLLNLVAHSELNAMVIDVKEDAGRITYNSEVPLAKEIGADKTRFIPDIDQLISTLQEHHIYPIARIVCFKDPLLARKRTDWAIQRKEGGLYQDRKGVNWIDPYRTEVWEYNIALAKEAARKGFKEIQFDYVRFPAGGKQIDQEVKYYKQESATKQQVIANFLRYARKELAPYQVSISADVFGLVPSVSNDMGIGQKWELISPEVDAICPMMYPSHYANGTYGLSLPDAKPYETIYRGLADGQQKNQAISANGLKPAVIRPWYQDFTATWVKGHIPYGAREVQAQIKAGKDRGVDQYLIWDAKNTYSKAAWDQNGHGK
ncbi:putative glycoside hydrolase [Brevibacillus sp. B_LB10_24]|uniref:putative glycoside hydrolase n=1 Tax=Brevibacillus sp. B_LB10_24 TaxID=3380645 RepID=UPI0038BBC0E2